MTTTTAPPEAPLPVDARPVPPTPVPALDVVVPVLNEEAGLESCLRRLHTHLATGFPYRFRITVADNASTDGTLAVAHRVAAELPGVTVVHLAEKGRGRALRAVWSASDAPVLAYMDVDLSTDLAALAPLVAPLLSGHSDLAIGSRLARGSRVVRGAKREVVSRCYNFLLRRTLAARFSDAQCGFKAIRAGVSRGLLPLLEDDGWFFDTELLVLAERARAGPDQRVAGAAALGVGCATARDRGRRAGRGQPGGDRVAVPAAAGLGVPGPAGGRWHRFGRDRGRRDRRALRDRRGPRDRRALRDRRGRRDRRALRDRRGRRDRPMTATVARAARVAEAVPAGGRRSGNPVRTRVALAILGGGSLGGGTRTAAAIQAWVQATFTATTVGGTTVHQLTG